MIRQSCNRLPASGASGGAAAFTSSPAGWAALDPCHDSRILPCLLPANILAKVPAQALSPALLELLDLMSGPMLLIEDSPAGEPRGTAPGESGATRDCVM